MTTYNPMAFPRPGFDKPARMQDGMTLRDYFAGQVVGGLITRPTYKGTAAEAATLAYAIADAMLIARKDTDA